MTVESLADLLDDAKIRLKRLTPGHTEHVLCPVCEGGRTREVSLAVTIDADGQGATWVCHRGSCGQKGGGKVPTAERHHRPAERVIQRPKPHTTTETSYRPDWLYEFFGRREIGARVVEKFGIYATKRTFGGLGERATIVFPYTFKGELVNRKYRPYPEKTPQLQDADALQTLFNIDALGPNPEVIIWVEGEPDVMALAECQIDNAVTLKDGAPATVSNNPNDGGKRFEALRTHADVLGKAKRIVLAGDMDGPGLALREELARRLGRHRCWLVEWPGGCKDACDTLRLCGPDAVAQSIAEATPYPIEGLQKVKIGTLLDLRRQHPPAVMTTGTMATDKIMALPTEGRLIVVTGYPASGKTAWVRFLMIHTASSHHRRWCVFSPEMQPWEQFAAQCAEVFHNKPFWPQAGLEGMTDDEIVRAETWLADRLTMLVADAEDQAPTMDWLIELARAAVLRDGVTDFLIDPWNEVDHVRTANMTETEYIGRALQRLKAFGLRHGVNVWIIAHPAKPLPLKQGEKRAAPGPYDISGTAHWFNKTDVGLTVHSAAPGSAEIHLWKPRFRRFGKRGASANLDFDEITGRFSTPIAPVDAVAAWEDRS